MDQITSDNCIVERAILHILDQDTDKPTLADEELTLDSGFKDFIRDHIVASLLNCNVAEFTEWESNAVCCCCQTIFSDPTQFVSQSHQLTQRIFSHMGAQTINRGTFLIATFRRQGNASNYLAMLKMTDTPAAPYRTEEHGEKHSVDIQFSRHALPQPQDKGKVSLDKAAFIAPKGDGDAYELRILDRKHKEKGGVATYFQSFLHCGFPQTDVQKTKIFNREVEIWIREHRNELPPTLPEQSLRELKHVALGNNASINVREFATGVFGTKHPELADSLVEHLKGAKLRDAEFEVDIQNIPKKTTFRFGSGDRKIEIKGNFDDIKELVKIQPPSETNPRYYITIEADSYEEIS